MPLESIAASADSAIPLHKPFLSGREAAYASDAIASGKISSDGRYTQACGRFLRERFGIAHVLMTPSCTAALEMAAILCDVRQGDEVILPSFTFVSTANAFVRLGARPVFADIRPDTLNLDEDAVEKAITPRTRAIAPVHYAGVACAMDRILATAKAHGLFVIEDAAQAVNAFVDGQALGSLGHLAAYSFHETKNFTCGEGGALCVNSPELFDRAEIIREKGTNRSQFFRHQVNKYTWVDVGSSYIPSELACACLFAQLEAMDDITERRREVDRRYRALLAPLASEGLLTLPSQPAGCVSNFHNFYILLKTGAIRDGLMAHLRRLEIAATFHFVPLHTSPMGQRFGYRDGDLPFTEDLSSRLLRLPFYPDLAVEQQVRIVGHVAAFLRQASPVVVPFISPMAQLAEGSLR